MPVKGGGVESDFSRFMEAEVYDLVARNSAGILGMDKTTMNNLVSLFQGEASPVDALKLLIMYIARQMGRGEIDRRTGRELVRTLQGIYGRFGRDREMLRAAVMKFLTLLKWVYDSRVRVQRGSNFEGLVRAIVGG